MVPFALLAPVVGPLLDRFRHGRRYALAATMLGRAFLAWVIADNLIGFGLYPAAFGVLALSRAYGVARSAAVPRLLPAGLGLSQAGARASRLRHGRRRASWRRSALARVLVRPAVAAAGRQRDLRGRHGDRAAAAARAPTPTRPRSVPQPFQLPVAAPRRRPRPVLSGRLVMATLVGSAAMRAAVRLPAAVPGLRDPRRRPAPPAAAARTWRAGRARRGRRRARRSAPSWPPPSAPGCASAARTALQAGRLIAGRRWLGVLATVLLSAWPRWSLLCLVTAIASGLAKLAVDAVIQERMPDAVRASAFAHSETLLMLAWVAGGRSG